MAYGTIKVDTITFTDAGVDKSVTISGLVQNPTFSGNITVTGTVSGNTIQGQTVSGATVTGGAAAFTTVTGGVATITSGVFALGSASNPSISFTGDANSGLYSPGADQVAISTGGAGRLFVDASGNVGVGGSPDQKLTVVGNIKGVNGSGQGIQFVNTATPYIQALGTSNINDLQISAQTIQLQTGTTYSTSERLRITSAGLVGIGTSSPNELLTVASGTDRVGINVSGTVSTLLIGNQNPATACSSISFDRGDGSLRFNNGVTGAITERARITSAGLVGIGTGSPSTNLHIGSSAGGTDLGVLLSRGATTNFFEAYDGTKNFIAGTDSSNAFVKVGSLSNHPVLIVQNNGEAIYIDTSKRVGVGTTSPITALHVDGTGNQYLRVSSSTYSNFVQTFAGDGSTGVEYKSVFRFVDTDNGERARIDSSGRLLVGTSSSSAEAKFIVQGGTTGAGGAVNIQRGATTASAGSTIGFINFTNSSNNVGATVIAEGDGTWTAGTSHPTRLVFSTTADGASSPTERMRIPNGGGLSVGTTVSPSAVNQQTAVRIGTLNVSQTTISNLTTTWTDITAAAGANGLAFVDIFNTSGGNQGNFLVSWRGFPANATVISSDNGTGLTINFQVSSGKLQMQTTSGTVSGAVYVWAG